MLSLLKSPHPVRNLQTNHSPMPGIKMVAHRGVPHSTGPGTEKDSWEYRILSNTYTHKGNQPIKMTVTFETRAKLTKLTGNKANDNTRTKFDSPICILDLLIRQVEYTRCNFIIIVVRGHRGLVQAHLQQLRITYLRDFRLPFTIKIIFRFQ